MGTDQVVTRRFLADPVTFVVRCPSRPICEAVEAAFVDLPDGDPATDPRVIQLREDAPGRFSVAVDDQTRSTDQAANHALGALVTNVTRLALDEDPERLHLHCAALSKDGKGVLVTAPSGTGKTTLAAKLLTRGWAYGSDESVAARADAATVEAFAKPLMIKSGGGGLVPELATCRVVLDAHDDQFWTVPASALGAEIEHVIDPQCLVVLTPDERTPDGGPSRPVSIHPADAVVAMMEQTMDPVRFGRRAVEVLAAIAARSHCVQMQVGPLDLAADQLERTLTESPTVHSVQVLDPAPSVALPWHVADHARSVLIGDRVVIHDAARGPITALDEAGTAVWRTLAGDPPEGWGLEVLQAPAMLAFLDQLMALGLVHAGERRSEPA